MKTAATFLLGVVVGAGALAVLSGHGLGSPSPPPPPLPPPPTTLPLPTSTCEATVKLSLVSDGTATGKKIVADPPHPVCLALGRPLTWLIDGAGEVTITFKPQGSTLSPFVYDSTTSPHNTGPGVYEWTSPDSRPILSNPANEVGVWIYKVKWKLPLTGEIFESPDPVVCIRR